MLRHFREFWLMVRFPSLSASIEALDRAAYYPPYFMFLSQRSCRHNFVIVGTLKASCSPGQVVSNLRFLSMLMMPLLS